MSVIGLAAHRVVATIPVGARPHAVALAGRRGFVANWFSNSLGASARRR